MMSYIPRSLYDFLLVDNGESTAYCYKSNGRACRNRHALVYLLWNYGRMAYIIRWRN